MPAYGFIFSMSVLLQNSLAYSWRLNEEGKEDVSTS